MIRSEENIPIELQCKLLGINRSTYYYTPVLESPLNLELMRKIDKQYLQHPWGQLKMGMVQKEVFLGSNGA